MSQPLWFGPQDLRLFGWYDAPRGARARTTGVVLCAPLFYEAVCTRRAYRHLAERLAAAGFPVLRFDYHGAGDSAGHDEQPGRVRAWLDSIGAAVDELRRLSGVSWVSLFGLRLGATLAAVAAAQRGDVDRLVLFAPCLTGRAYLRGLRALRLLRDPNAGGRKAAAPAEGEEAAGFLLTKETVSDLGRLDLLALPRAPAARALVLGRDDLPSCERTLSGRLQDAGVEATLREVSGYAALMRDPHLSTAPEAAFDAVVSWLEETEDTGVTGRASPDIGNGAEAEALSLGDVRERPVGAPGRIFGVLAEPTGRRRRTGVLLLNAGAVPHIGPSRMHVTFARAWAARGFSVLRLDVPGIGDLAPPPGRPEVRLYSLDAIGDVRAAMDLLAAAQGLHRFVLAGLCSGAYLAFHTALADPRVAGCVLINPQTFTWREGDSLEVRRREHRSVRYYSRAIWQRETWIRALRGQIRYGGIAAVLRKEARRLAHAGLGAAEAWLRGEAPRENTVAQAFRTLLDRGTDCLLVYSREDPGLDELEAHLGRGVPVLRPRRNFRLEIIDGPDHTFTPIWTQQLLGQLLMEHLLHLEPDGQAR